MSTYKNISRAVGSKSNFYGMGGGAVEGKKGNLLVEPHQIFEASYGTVV